MLICNFYEKFQGRKIVAAWKVSQLRNQEKCLGFDHTANQPDKATVSHRA